MSYNSQPHIQLHSSLFFMFPQVFQCLSYSCAPVSQPDLTMASLSRALLVGNMHTSPS